VRALLVTVVVLLACAGEARAAPGIDGVRTTIEVDTTTWPVRVGQRTVMRADASSPAIRDLWSAVGAAARDDELRDLLLAEGAIDGGGFGIGEPGMDLSVRDAKAYADRYVWNTILSERDLTRYFPWRAELDGRRLRLMLDVGRSTPVAVGAGVTLKGPGRVEAVTPVPLGSESVSHVRWERVPAGHTVRADVRLPWRAAAAIQPAAPLVRDAGFGLATALVFLVVLHGIAAAPAARRVAARGLGLAVAWVAIITVFDVAGLGRGRELIDFRWQRIIAGFVGALALLWLLRFSRQRHAVTATGQRVLDGLLGIMLLVLTAGLAIDDLASELDPTARGVLGVGLTATAGLVAALAIARLLGAPPRQGAQPRIGTGRTWIVAGLVAAAVATQWALATGAKAPMGEQWLERWAGAAVYAPYALLPAMLVALTVVLALALVDRLDDPGSEVAPLLSGGDPLSVSARIGLAAMAAAFVTVKITVGSVPMPIPFAVTFALLALLLARPVRVSGQLSGIAGRRREVLEAALECERLDRRAAATHTTWFDGHADREAYRSERDALARQRARLDIGGTAPQRLAFAVGPGASWLSSARAAIRPGLWFATLPVAFWLGDAIANRWDTYWGEPFGLVILAQGLVGELAFWIVAAFVLGALFAHLPGPNGFVKGGLLGALLGLAIAFTVGVLADAHASGWQLRCVMLVLYLGAVGAALDVISVRAVGLHWRAILDLYRLRVARFSVVYALSVIGGLFALGQQIASGGDLPGVLQSLGSLIPGPPGS
jgi:hypothetical protein